MRFEETCSTGCDGDFVKVGREHVVGASIQDVSWPEAQNLVEDLAKTFVGPNASSSAMTASAVRASTVRFVK